jgi:hypothetical protein
MARPEVTGRKPQVSGPPVAREAYTVREFCAAYRISEDMFWKMRRAGWAPALMKVGTKVLISTVAAEQWKHEREAAGARDLAEV